MKKNVFAYILIIIGVLTLLGNYGFIQGEFFLLIVGISFLVVYFRSEKKIIGFLIPGIIVSMVGIFSNVENYLYGFDGPVFLAMLGASFIIINFIHSRQIGSQRESKWANYVGGILLIFSIFVLVVDNFDFAPANLIFENIFPVGLILFGLYKLIKSKDKKEL